MKAISDEIRMMEVKNGNLDAMAPLFEKYNINLYNYFLKMTRDKQISENLKQNVFQRILLYRNSYNDAFLFRSWMFQIARNTLNKHYNERKYVDFNVDIENHSGVLIDDSEGMTEKNEMHSSLKRAMNRLTDDDKEIIELARFQELKYKEISEMTGLSVAAVKVKVHRAIRKLRTYYFESI